MKISILTALCSSILMMSISSIGFAERVHPEGGLTIYNASNKAVTAELSSAGRFTLANNERKDVTYSALSRVCATTPTNCTAQFYINNAKAGSATINVTNGNLVDVHVNMKIRTQTDPDKVLRTVVFR